MVKRLEVADAVGEEDAVLLGVAEAVGEAELLGEADVDGEAEIEVFGEAAAAFIATPLFQTSRFLDLIQVNNLP